MKKSKMILIMLAMLLAAFSQLRAELPAPLIEVKDTLCRMNNNQGNAKGAVFMPNGNTIIGIMDDTPIVIDALTGQEIRRMDSIPKKNVGAPQISKDGKYLFAESDLGLAVWDIQTGKILKYLRFCADYCLSPDGNKLYETISNDKNNTGVIRVYDLKTLEEIEIFCGHNFWGGGEIAISPDGQTLAVCVSHDPIGNEEDNINRSVILIDLNKKTEFTRLESFYPYNHEMQFSPDGNHLMYNYCKAIGDVSYLYIYNLISKAKKFIKDEDIRSLFEYKTSAGFGHFYDNQTISIDYSKYILIWNFQENRLKKMINFYAPYHDINNNKLLLCSYQGNLAILDLAEVSVSEIQKSDESFITYKDSQLLFNLDKSFIGEASIYDTSGKQIVNLGTQTLIAGNNVVKVNHPLPRGMYILTIKSEKEHYSNKFIVE